MQWLRWGSSISGSSRETSAGRGQLFVGSRGRADATNSTRDLIDLQGRFAHRSIRRRPTYQRIALVSNALTAGLIGRPLRAGAAAVEVNETSRPYHLGWILEAWAGRDVGAVLSA